jgi:hypothetical protein
MSVFQPAPVHKDFTPQILIALAAGLLLFASFFLVSAALERQRFEKHVAPDSTIAKTVSLVPGANPLTTQTLTAQVHATSLESAVMAALKGPDAEARKAGIFSEIPKGTQLLGVSVSGNIVTLDLSREFESGGGATSVIGRVEALKKTVRGVNPHYRMKLAIEGKPLRILTGEGLELDE